MKGALNMNIYQKKMFFGIVVAAAMCLTSCSSTSPTEETTDFSSESSTTSELTTETEGSETEESTGDSFTTYVDDTASFTIFWTEDGQNKSEEISGIVSPDIIIHSVLEKYGYEEIPDLGAADWTVSEYYSDTEDEDGLKRTAKYSATIDIDEGFSAFVGDDLESVANDIGKSLISSYNLSSVRVCELREDIITIEE